MKICRFVEEIWQKLPFIA